MCVRVFLRPFYCAAGRQSMHAMIAPHVEITALASLSADPFLARESIVIGQRSSLRLLHQPIGTHSSSLVRPGTMRELGSFRLTGGVDLKCARFKSRFSIFTQHGAS